MSEDIKKQFIVSDSFDQIENLARMAIKFGRVSQNGSIIIDKAGLSQENKIKLSLVLRFIAGSLDESISKTITPKELTSLIGERNESVGSRLSLLSKEGFCRTENRGTYIVNHYKIIDFLDNLDDSNHSIDQKTSKGPRRVRTTNRKEKALTGIGADIQQLITDGFFSQPRFLNEVENELKKENNHHDIRVIDNTIRNVFLSGRRSIKRIPNKEGGRSKWKYVNR